MLSNPALERLNNPAISELMLTDTIPLYQARAVLKDKLTIIPSAPIIASSLEAIVSRDSLLQLFEGRNYI